MKCLLTGLYNMSFGRNKKQTAHIFLQISSDSLEKTQTNNRQTIKLRNSQEFSWIPDYRAKPHSSLFVGNRFPRSCNLDERVE